MRRLYVMLPMLLLVLAGCASVTKEETQRAIHTFEVERLAALNIDRPGLLRFRTDDGVTGFCDIFSDILIVYNSELPYPGAISGSVVRNGPIGAEMDSVIVFFRTKREVLGFKNALENARLMILRERSLDKEVEL